MTQGGLSIYQRIISVLVISIIVVASMPIVGSNPDDPYWDDVFIGFISKIEIGHEDNYSYFYLESILVYHLYYRDGELISSEFIKPFYFIKIAFKELSIKGYVGNVFIFAKITTTIW
jgi:hypothetical protein